MNHSINIQLSSSTLKSHYRNCSKRLCVVKASRHDEKPHHYTMLIIDGIELNSGTAMATLMTMGIT